MPLRLYDAFVPNAQQQLGALLNLIDKGEAHCRENDLDDRELIEAKLAEDMWPLPWHVRSCWVQTGYTIRCFEQGEFTPDFSALPETWADMRAMTKDAIAELDAVDPETLEGFADKTIGFVMNGKRMMEMTGQNFLLSFSQPNLYFHATTFYDILRMKGVAIGKRDFLGRMRIIGQ